jgi:hypothetical protein
MVAPILSVAQIQAVQKMILLPHKSLQEVYPSRVLVILQLLDIGKSPWEEK